MVDAITGLGTTHLDMDGWGMDVLIGGSQKAVMIPPGLSYLAVSHAGMGPHGSDLQSALLLRPAQGAQEREERRKRLHARGGADRRARRCARLDRRAGRRRPRAEGRKKLVDNAETIAAMTRAACWPGLELFSPVRPLPPQPPSSTRRRRLGAVRQGAEEAASRPSSPTARAR